MKKLIKILPVTLLIIYLILAFGFVSDQRKNVICSEIKIIIRDSLSRSFYNPEDIRNVFLEKGLKLEGYPLYSLNTRKLEELFIDKPYIRKVEIYATASGILEVGIEQREPVIRIYTNESRSFYLDEEGNIMPESPNYTPFVMIANGHFPGGSNIQNASNIFNLKEIKRFKPWLDVLELINELNKNTFWKNQFVQIYLNRKGKFELIPRVGSHIIILGDVSELDEKLQKLKSLYLEGFLSEGWNNYERIDLRYKNQVVCTKR